MSLHFVRRWQHFDDVLHIVTAVHKKGPKQKLRLTLQLAATHVPPLKCCFCTYETYV